MPGTNVQVLLRNFVSRMPEGTETDLVKRWREQTTETHYPPSGLLKKRATRMVPLVETVFHTQVVARGWPVPHFGRKIRIQSGDSDTGTAPLDVH